VALCAHRNNKSPATNVVGLLMAEDEGFDLINVRLRQAFAGGAECAPHLDGFESPSSKKHPTTDVVECFLAEDEGFEFGYLCPLVAKTPLLVSLSSGKFP